MAQASSARRNGCRVAILGAALAAAVGCTGKDKNETGMRGLDPRVKAALTAPAGTPSKDSTKSKLAITDPNATGAKDVNRKQPSNPLMPINTGTLASNTGPAVVTPTQPTSGGLLFPQKHIEQVKYEASPVMQLDGPLPKPVMPLDNPIPSDEPTPPPQPIAAAITPPATTALPMIPDSGLVTLPLPNEKAGTGLPVTPPALK